MAVNRRKFAAAFTLAEVMVAMAILVIASLGALSYQYLAAKHARIARAQIAGTRTAQLLLEDWKSTGGSEEYDPAALGLGFSDRLQIPGYFSQGEGGGLGSPLHDRVYEVTVENFPMVVMLKWKDVNYDIVAQTTLRQLAVMVEFGEVTGTGNLKHTSGWSEGIPRVVLTTYVRRDASSG